MEKENKKIKFNWKYGVISVILTGLLFVGIICLIDYFSGNGLQSLNSYLFQGIFFGIFMGIGFPYATQKYETKFMSKLGGDIKPELEQDENIEMEGSANLFRSIEGVGGKLFLTNKRIVFKSHKINIQQGQTDIPYGNIDEIKKRKTTKLIDNGIRIKTNEGNVFDFVVNEQEKWIEKLNNKITRNNNL